MDFTVIQNAATKIVDNFNSANTKIDDLEERATDLEQEVAVLDSRMDVFTALPEGATTNDAALEDITVGYDGTIYEGGPGDAVRAQVGKLNDDLADLKEVVKNPFINLKNEYSDDIGIDLTSTSTASTVNITATNNKVPLTEGDVIAVIYDITMVDGTWNETKRTVKPALRSFGPSNNLYNDEASTYGYADKVTFDFGIPVICSSVFTIPSSANYQLSIVANTNTGASTTARINNAIILRFPKGTNVIFAKEIISDLYDDYGFADSYEMFSIINNINDRLTPLEKISPNKKTVVYWGNSLTTGNQDGSGVSRASVMRTLLGDEWTVYNFGSGGETSNTIACRQGGLGLVVKPNQTISASGTSLLDLLDNEGNEVNFGASTSSITEAFKSLNPCVINGISGSLRSGDTYGSSPYQFVRAVNGDAVQITRPTNVVTNGQNFTGNIVIIEVGQNGGYDDTDMLIRQIKQMLDFNGSDKYLVCGFVTEGKTVLNEAMKKAFGRHFIDTMKYASTPIYDTDNTTIISSYGLDDMGLQMTALDLERIENGLMPKSLQIDDDNIHLNRYGYTLQARLEYQRGKDLGYW